MQKVKLILLREYEARAFSKAFLILCFVLPMLLSAMFMSTAVNSKSEKKEVDSGNPLTFHVIDESNLLDELPAQVGNIRFKVSSKSLENDMSRLKNRRIDGILNIYDSGDQRFLRLYTNKQIASNDRHAVDSSIHDVIVQSAGLPYEESQTLVNNVKVIHVNAEGGNQPNVHWETVVGIAMACMIYFFIFFYGVRTLNAVAEEKMNRISEIIISSVSPFELMLGKILGTTLAVFTQVIIVSCFTIILTKSAMALAAPDPLVVDVNSMSNDHGIPATLFNAFSTGEFIKILFGFLIFFIFGFMLYAAVFAAIGSAMEPNADTLQFIFPVLIPLVFSLIVAITSAFSNPDNNVVMWTSFIPFTSPVVMTMRLAHGVSWWELILSIVLLIGTFIAITFLAGRIFRVGILLYGTKPSFKMVGKWLLSTE